MLSIQSEKTLPGKPKRKKLTTQLGLLIVIAILIILGCFASPYFFKVNNFQNIVKSLAVTGILALGETFVILTAGIDLSVGGALALCSVIAAKYASGSNMAVFILAAVGIGILIGVVNGAGVISGRIPSFIMTLATLNVCRGLCYVISKSMPIYFTIPGFMELSKILIVGIPLPGFVFLIIAIIAIFSLKYFPFGRELYAVGSNEEVARMCGLHVKRTLLLAYVISGLLAGIAAVVYTSYTSVAQSTAGEGYELDAIAMTVIGGTSLVGGRGGIVGTLFGVVIMALLRNIFNLLNLQSPMQQILIGVCLAVAVLIQAKGQKK